MEQHVELIQRTLESIAELKFARNAEDALDELLELEEGRVHYDVIILDKRLPLDESKIEDQEFPVRSGSVNQVSAVDPRFFATYMLKDLRRLGILASDVPVIVFTAYPDFDDCTECIKNGAFAYISKAAESGARVSGWEKLRAVCEGLLDRRVHMEAIDVWFERNIHELMSRYRNQFVAVFDVDAFPVARNDGVVLDGMRVLCYNSYDKAKNSILSDRQLRWCAPKIIGVGEIVNAVGA